MTYQKSFKDLAEKYCWCSCHPIRNGKPVMYLHCSGCGGTEDISGYRRKSWPLVILTLAFTALVIGGLIYGLYNANQIEKVGRNQCLVVHDVTC